MSNSEIATASVQTYAIKTKYHRRKQASEYLQERWGIPCAAKTLAKWAVTGEGPAFRKAGKFPLYSETDLDVFAVGRIGPRVHSTSELRGA